MKYSLVTLVLATFLASCNKDRLPVPANDGKPHEMLFDGLTRAGVAVTPFDGSMATLKTFRAILLDSDYPWNQYAAEGTYCNIYKYPASASGEKWYHPVQCDTSGVALTDDGSVITGWSGSEGNYSATCSGGTASAFDKSKEETSDKTWGNSKYALWAGTEDSYQSNYRLFIVSPAKAVKRYRLRDSEGNLLPDEEQNYRYGIYQTRTGADSVKISPCIPVILSGTYLAHYGYGSQYVFRPDYGSGASDDDDLTFNTPKSKLSLETYVDEALNKVHVGKIVLSNYITDGIYVPIDEDTGNPAWVYDWDGTNHLFANEHLLPEDEFGSDANYSLKSDIVLDYKNGEGAVNPPVKVFDSMYLLSQDYSELDVYGRAVHPLPVITVVLLSTGSGGTEEMKVEIPLSWNFKPQVHYHMTLRIATWYLGIYVQALDWDTERSEDHNLTFTFGDDPDIIVYLDDDNWIDGGEHHGNV